MEARQVKIRRRIGRGPDLSGGRKSCPDCFELEDGSIAVIGRDATDALKGALPDDASCALEERIVVIPRALLDTIINDMK